jgi:S-adenosylmethionine:tRNA ribosyltransferase-isomerase
MRTQEFDFEWDPKAMPQDPVSLRGKSRESGKMLVLDRSTQTSRHTVFSHICDFFRPGDLLILNDSYMLSNTLKFHANGTDVHVTVYGHEPDNTAIVSIEPKQPWIAPGATLTSSDEPALSCHLVEPQKGEDGLWRARYEPIELLMPTLELHGHRLDETVPLNPGHWKNSRKDYRSVYAKTPGSLEIPSAGLHFSKALLAQAVDKGVEIAYITLHVGATETLAVRHISEEEIEDHKVRSEYFEVSETAAAQISKARAEGRRVVAVGTTVMRTLETLAQGKEKRAPLPAQKGWTGLYIYPGFDFRAVDVLLTNLHRPRSSHIVLTAAFAGKDFVMRCYDEIAERGDYEFDMFGDSMLIV